MTPPLRIVGLTTATPANDYPQEALRDALCYRLFGDDWAARSDVAESVRLIERLYAASRVEHRQMAVELHSFYLRESPPTTGERMEKYEQLSYPLAREALAKHHWGDEASAYDLFGDVDRVKVRVPAGIPPVRSDAPLGNQRTARSRAASAPVTYYKVPQSIAR